MDKNATLLADNMKKNNEKKRKFKVRYVLFALLGIILYLVLGGALPYLHQPDVSEEFKKSFSVEAFYGEGESVDRACIVEDNGEALEERIRMISQAEEHIVLCTFDFRADTSGKKIIAALMAASKRGVKVDILVDGVAFFMRMEDNPHFQVLSREENITIKAYNTINLLTPWKGMSRMHDKYLIADDYVYLLGGRNTFNYFLGDQKGHKNYDRDVLVVNTGGKGSSIYQLKDYFEGIWEQEECREWHVDKEKSEHKDARAELDKIYSDMKAENKYWFTSTDYVQETVSTHKITLLSNPTELYSKEPRVFYSLSKLMENAKDRVVVHTPYVICNSYMYDAFKRVRDKGIEISMMTNSAANNGNPFGAVDLVKNKEDILETGINLLEYNGGVSYHAKSLLIDDDISIVGSFNIDMRSAYQDTELMLVVHSEELNGELSDIMESYEKDADEAVVSDSEFKELMVGQNKIKKKLQRGFLWLIDPLVRFLM